MHRESGPISRLQGQPLLQGQAGHAVDAAIAGGDQGDSQALAGQLQGFGAALPFQGELAVTAQLVRAAQGFEQV